MFEQTFKMMLTSLTSDGQLVDKLWSEIKDSYDASGRHYHTLSHLDNLLAELSPLRDEIQDWQTLLFSIAYHDVIYNVLQSDNEEKSAKLASDRLTMLPVAPVRREKCFSQIMATKKHGVVDDGDTNLFTDADLAVLGADNETYNRYVNGIRKEYHIYPTLIYKPGRRKVLHHFLEMPSIYKTGFFRNKYEERARANLGRELQELSS